MTKRKLMLVALSLCMVAILAMGSTLAYLTDEAFNKNVIIVGNIDISLDEAPVSKGEEGTENEDKWIADENADRVTENTYEHVYPGVVVPKDPTVHNNGINDAYVRVVVDIPNGQNILPYYGDTMEAAFLALINNTLGEGWEITAEINDTEGTGYSFVITYNERLASGESTPPVFEEIYIYSGWDNDEVTALGLGNWTIDIRAEAIQAEGFENVGAAFYAWGVQADAEAAADGE